MDLITNRWATFSEDRRHRYLLCRELADNPAKYESGQCVFVMLNPSTADDQKEDPTVRRCVRYAYDWGFRKLVVLNIFSVRSTDPKGILEEGSEGDPFNWNAIHATVTAPMTARLVLAWGDHGTVRARGAAILENLRAVSEPTNQVARALCFGRTRSGQPLHPLYLPKTQKLVRWW